MRARWLLLGLVLLGAGCAARTPLMLPGMRFPELRSLEARVEGLSQRLRMAMSCGDTCRVAEAICEAAEKICEIAEEHPEESDFPPRCDRARGQCEGARQQCQRCEGG